MSDLPEHDAAKTRAAIEAQRDAELQKAVHDAAWLALATGGDVEKAAEDAGWAVIEGWSS